MAKKDKDKKKKENKASAEKEKAAPEKEKKKKAKAKAEKTEKKKAGAKQAPAQTAQAAAPAEGQAAQAAPAKEKKLPRKERKKRKKQTRKQQLELEKQLVKEGKIPPRNKYKANGFFWRVFALCLAFFFGIFGAIGGLVGFGAFAPVDDVAWLVGFDVSSVLNEEYASQSIFDLIGTIASEPFDSLGAVSKYTPILDKYLGDMQTSLADLGVHLDIEEVKATKFDALGSYMKENVMNTIVLGETLGLGPESDGLILGICYGEEGTDYTVQDGKIVMNEGKAPLTIGDLTKPGGSNDVIKKITIEQALGVSGASNAAMRFLAYGTEGTEYRIDENGEVVMLENEYTGELFKKKTLADLTDDGATPIENAKISDLITVESETGILAAIKDWKISDLEDSYRIERLRISQIMEIGEDASNISKAIANWRIGDLTDAKKMDTLTLADVMTVDESSPLILRSLADTPIGEFSDAVDGLRLADILELEDFEGNNFLKTLRMSSLTSLSEDLKKLSAADVFGEKMYSYLDPAENENKHYATLYDDYQKGHETADGSDLVPTERLLAEGESVRSYFVPKDGPETRLQGGYYTGAEGSYTAVPAGDVHVRKTEGEEPGTETVTYYTKGEQKLTPAYDWKLVDYESEALVPLPEGDSISADYGDFPVRQSEGTPYTDEAGDPLYYLTTRPVFADGAPTGETEPVAYPLLENDFGVYYEYLRYTPGEEGPDEFRLEHVDLDYALISLSYERDGETVTLEKDENGDWKEQAEEGSVFTVYEKKAVEDGEETVPGYYFIKTETAAEFGYYAEEGEIGAVYAADGVTEKFEIVTKNEAGEVQTAVPVDRYLSGVWFFLFGTDEDADGNVIVKDESGNFIDRSHMPVLDLTDVMTGMSDSLSHTELWQLYFHGLLDANPYVDLASSHPEGIHIGEKTVKNLNECTVVECIALVKALIGS